MILLSRDNTFAKEAALMKSKSCWLRGQAGWASGQLIYVVVFMVELYHLGEKVLAHPLEIKESRSCSACSGSSTW